MSKTHDDEPRKSTGIVQVEKAAHVAELEISDRDKARNDRIALVQAVFDGLRLPSQANADGYHQIGAFACGPVAAFGQQYSWGWTDVTTTDGATTITSSTAATTTGPTPEPAPPAPPEPLTNPREDDTP